jgi:type IV pilus assembly protein PilW
MRERGFQMVELCVALALGLVLIAAFLAALRQCQALFATHESVASLQDASRHALSILVPDLEHAGFYGFTNLPAARTPGALPASVHACGVGFATDLVRPVQGSNNGYSPDPSATDCAPTRAAAGARPGADTLVVRHASLDPSAPRAGRVQLYSRRLASHEVLDVFADGRAPGPVDRDREIRDLEVRIYYVANASVGRAGWPSLRVKSLTESGGSPQFRDEEVMPGVEDLQVEFGIAGPAGGRGAARFVTADSPDLAAARIVAVRLWLRIRADQTEGDYHDDRSLDYADARFTPTPDEARHRRVLIERTVALRNAT